MRAKFLHTGSIILFFLLSSIIMTYPQILGMGTMVGDPYNNLHSAYLIGEGSKIWTQPFNLWDAKFHFPRSRAFSCSPGLIGFYLLAGPVYLLSKNVIFAFNFYLLLVYFLNGLCMFFLARHLIKNTYAAILAGFIFAYCPFRFSAPQLVTMMSMFWICLALLFLHKFVESGSQSYSNRATLSSNAMLFAFFFGMQFLTDPSSGLFFLLMLGLYLIFHLATKRLLVNKRTLLNLAVSFLIIVPVVLAAIYPSYRMMRSRGTEDMTRGLEETQILSCNAGAYLVTAPTNLLYGWITKKYGLTRAQYLFPGIIVGILFFLGLLRRRGSHVKESGEKGFLVLLGILGALISFGPYIQFFGFRVCPGPYMLLYYCLPGFKSLRAIGWSAILLLIPFAIFCGEGAAMFLDRLSSPRKKIFLFICLLSFITIEYFNKNASGDYFTAQNFHVSREAPKVYEWLKQQEGDFGVIELPMPENDGEFETAGHENYYMLWSLYHGKRIVNGYSSFPPPEYWPLADLMANFPSPETMAVLRALGVKYIIVHADRYDYNEFERKRIGHGLGQKVVEQAGQFKDDLAPVGKFESSYVLEPKKKEVPPEAREKAAWRRIKPEENWKATTNIHQDMIANIFDGDPGTVWNAFRGYNIYNNNNHIQIDFRRPLEISRIMIQYNSFREFPRGLVVEVSENGKEWEKIDTRCAYRDLVIGILNNPRMREFDIVFAPTKTRYLKLTQTLPSICWSINELNIYSETSRGHRKVPSESSRKTERSKTAAAYQSAHDAPMRINSRRK